jgi:hypothetical protein
MNNFKSTLLTFLFALLLQTSDAQVTGADPDKIYGFDPLLVNGRVYTFSVPQGTEGNQFIVTEFDRMGKVSLRGTTYENLILNYDVYNQQLILKYVNSLGSTSLMEISQAWLNSFEVNNQHFEVVTTSDTAKRFCQVIGSGQYSVCYYYFRDLVPDTRTSSKKLVFTRCEREMFVYQSNRLIRYKNNRSFVSVFNNSQKEMIRKYLRKNKIRVRKAADDSVMDLITYCNSLQKL